MECNSNIYSNSLSFVVRKSIIYIYIYIYIYIMYTHKTKGDVYYFADINECTGSHGCSHGCSNTIGSFLCTCPEGLFLSDDRRNCNGNHIQCFVTHSYSSCHHTTGCGVNNGGCDQICMQDSLGYSCSCLDGYTLGSDGKDCHYTESKFCSMLAT